MPRRPTPPPPGDHRDGSLDPVLLFLQAVWQLEHALERASKRMEDAIGISGPQRFALRMIGERPGITAGELAAVLHLHPSTVTGVVQRLHARKLVRRASSHVDRRITHLHLTAAGRKVNTPSVHGTVEWAARATLAGCPPSKLRATRDVLRHFAAELTKI